MSYHVFHERICSECGKSFIPAVEHMYKDDKLKTMYCSYTCWLHRGEGDAKKPHPQRKKVEEYSLDGDLIRVYDSANQAADYNHCSLKVIQKSCRVGSTYLNRKWRYAKS